MVDVAILGAGPAGYAAAFRAADLGLSVALIDPEANPGGVCLYRGCIPSKALLHISALIEEASHAHEWGVEFLPPKIDLEKLRAYKNQITDKITDGLGKLTQTRKIQYIRGKAALIDSSTLLVTTSRDEMQETLSYKNCIIATGSHPIIPPPFALPSPRIMDSTEALELPDIPQSLLIIGGGVIGMELATVYSALGTEVTVVEMSPKMLGPADKDLTSVFMRTMKSKLKESLTRTKVVSLKEVEGGIEALLEGPKVTQTKQVYEKVLLSIGRKPNVEGIGLENLDLKLNQGFIQVDSQMKTNHSHIFAIGDVVGNPMLAHKGSHEGHVAAEVIAGLDTQFQPKTIPSVVFTNPEVAWCGLTETEAKANNITYKTGKFPWAASGRATSISRNDGVTKILFDPESQKVLGVGIVGVGAGELLGEGLLALQKEATAQDIIHTIHPHPTLSETMMEAAEVFLGQSDHYYVPKRK